MQQPKDRKIDRTTPRNCNASLDNIVSQEIQDGTESMRSPEFGALAGLRVLDLTMVLAGPFCSMLLADHGADVIKIEPPSGDMTRKLGPFFADDAERAYGGYFQSVNRNKRSIALDLKSQAGKDVFLRLAETADVIVENFRPGVMDRLGLGYELLSARNRRLVYAALRGFGDPRTGSSPLADWPAYDVVAQAVGGIMGVTGPSRTQPLKVGPGVGDMVPGLFLAFGLLAAVRHAERTGQGQFVDVAMYDAVLALCERIVYQFDHHGKSPGPEGNHHPLLCPFGIFPTSDGWAAIGCPEDAFWVDLCAAMGRPEMARDAAFATTRDRVANSDRVIRAVTDWSSQLTKAQIAALIGGRVPFGPVHTAEDIFTDPHVVARGMLATLDHAGSNSRATVANTPIRMTRTEGGARSRAPRLSENAVTILEEVGYTQIEIASLRAQSVVG